jgi:Zn-dependent protease
MDWWLARTWSIDPMLAVAWVLWVIASVVLHELGHGVAAIRCGDDTPRLTGHMTWNPLVHMGTWSLIMFALFGFTWGMMPVNPNRFRGRYDDAKVAFAGPLVNLILFSACAVLAVLWVVYAGAVPDPMKKNMFTLLWAGVMINIVLFLFNLLPVPPLDGSRILATFSPGYARLWQGENGAIIGMIAFALVFFVVGGRVAEFGMDLAHEIIGAGVRLLR